MFMSYGLCRSLLHIQPVLANMSRRVLPVKKSVYTLCSQPICDHASCLNKEVCIHANKTSTAPELTAKTAMPNNRPQPKIRHQGRMY